MPAAVQSSAPPLPDDPVILQEMVCSYRSELHQKQTELHHKDLLIEKLKAQLSGMKRSRFGASSEALAQIELELEDREVAQACTPAPAEAETPEPEKEKDKRRPLPDHLPRVDQVIAPPTECCAQCGGQLKTLGEDVTEELEYVPGRFRVNRIVRTKLSCACCSAIHQAPLSSRPIERGRPGPGLLAHVLVSKYADHLPLYRQAQIYGRDGVDLDRSTLAQWVGKSTALLALLAEAVGRHVKDGPALFADDTPARLLAPGTGKSKTGRVWAYVRDERGWGGEAPAAAWYQYSPDRKGHWPEQHLSGFKGAMHADGYAGFNGLYETGAIAEVACMAHIRRKFFDVHAAQGSAVAAEALERIAGLYAIEKDIRSKPPDIRAKIRQEKSRPLFDDLETWLGDQLRTISGKTPLAAAIRYALSRMKKLRPWLADGRLELDNNAAERAMRPVTLGRKNYLFMGSDQGGRAAAIAYTLIETAKLNNVDPQAWITDTLARIPEHKINKIHELLPWNFNPTPS